MLIVYLAVCIDVCIGVCMSQLHHRCVFFFFSFNCTLLANSGSWRPDILYPKENPDHFQVCEINARFPFNGFYASHEKNNILGQLSYLKGEVVKWLIVGWFIKVAGVVVMTIHPFAHLKQVVSVLHIFILRYSTDARK